MNVVVVFVVMVGSAALVLLGAPELLARVGVIKFSQMPIAGMTAAMITQRFGDGHNGIDVAVPIGTPCLSVAPGVVVNVIDSPTARGGKQVIVKGRFPFAPNIGWGYAHLSRIDVVKGQEVNPGDLIGLSGNTGATRAAGEREAVMNRTDGRGAHLHFTTLDVTRDFLGIDPAPFLPEPIGGNV